MLRTDGVVIGYGSKTDVLARLNHLVSANLSDLVVDGYMVAEGRNLQRAVLKDARLHNIRVSGWQLQGADCSGMRVEGCDCRNWNLENARVQGLRFIRCQVDGLKASGLKASALQDCVGIPAETGTDE